LDPRKAQNAKRLRLVVAARLSDAKLESKLLPLLAMPEVAEVALVRRAPLRVAGVRNLCPPAALRAAPLAESHRLWSLARACLASPRPSFLIGFFFMPHVVYIELLRRALGIPTIPVALSQEDVERAERARFFRRALLNAHAVGVRGANSLDRLRACGVPAERLFTPPNVFEAGPFVPDPSATPEADFAFVGGLERVKRLPLLLEALALVRRARPEVRLLIVGDGPERAALETLAERLELRANVAFAGACAPAAVARTLQRARAFVMCSRHEGLPMAMLEALCCGTPVVAPDAGDVTTVARDGENAWVVREHTPAAYAQALLGMLEDDARRSRLAAGARAARPRLLAESSLDAALRAWRYAFSLPPRK
jgi:glycosyltransferase involved in cell wall biosynthesis